MEIQAQYEALTSGAGLVDVSDRTQLELTGADRAKFLQNLCTNDVKKLAPGAGCEAFVTNAQGKIVGHVFVFCRAESLVVETVPDQAAVLLAHLDRYLIREDVQLHDRNGQWGELLLSGSRSEGLLRGLLTVDVPQPPLSHVEAELSGVMASIRRVALTGPACLLIACQAEDVEKVRLVLQQAGASACGQEAFEIARIEAGSPFYGRDITIRNLPQEVARDKQAISFVKGCYLGQETVARIDALGHVNRALAALKFSGPQTPPAGIELTSGEKTAGQVTSSAYSPRLGAPMALGYVRREHNKPGAKLSSPFGEAEVIELAQPRGA